MENLNTFRGTVENGYPTTDNFDLDILDDNLINESSKPACLAKHREIISTYHDYFSNPEKGNLSKLKEKLEGTECDEKTKELLQSCIAILSMPLALYDTFGSDRNARSNFKKQFKEGSEEYKAMESQRIRAASFSGLQDFARQLFLINNVVFNELKDTLTALATKTNLKMSWEYVECYGHAISFSDEFAREYNDLSFNAKLNIWHDISLHMYKACASLLKI